LIEDLLLFAAFVAAWIWIQTRLLPRLGVPT
jgi:hypothetical protein